MSLEAAVNAGTTIGELAAASETVPATTTAPASEKAVTLFTGRNIAIAIGGIVLIGALVYGIVKTVKYYTAKRLAAKAEAEAKQAAQATVDAMAASAVV